MKEYAINGKTVPIENHFIEDGKYSVIPMKLYY